MRHTITVLLLAAGLVVLVAGCGSGHKSAAPRPGTTGARPTGTGGTGKSGPTGAGVGAGFASADNCLQVDGLPGSIAGMSSSAMSATAGRRGDNPGSSLARVSNGERQVLHVLAAAAPSDIKGGLRTYEAVFASFLQSLEAVGYKPGQVLKSPSAAQTAALVRAGRALLHAPGEKQAWRQLHTWARANCKTTSTVLGQ